MDIEAILKERGLAAGDIRQIYYGGDHVCRCGCKGRYADRGTPLFARYMTQLAKAPLAGPVETAEDKCWVNLPTDASTYVGRCFCLYFRD